MRFLAKTVEGVQFLNLRPFWDILAIAQKPCPKLKFWSIIFLGMIYWFKLAFLGWATHQVPHQSPRPQAEGFGEALGELNSPEKTN